MPAKMDSSFAKTLHKGTASDTAGFAALLKKDHVAGKAASDEYFRHWDNKPAEVETEADRAARKEDYATLTTQYYNLATDLYEYAFGQSFHFCRAASGESFKQGLARHEHYLAHRMRLRADMHVLDAGCGVGGPAREIAKFVGCRITGLSIAQYQIERAARYAEREALGGQLSFLQGDFMDIPFGDNTFDAVYAIEATVHAPTLRAVYAEIFRVLKPGGTFGLYEWVMTDSYDENNLHHREIRIGIERGSGIANIRTASEAVTAMKEAGFNLLECEDLAERKDVNPWYWPLDGGSWTRAQTLGDLSYTFRMTGLGRLITHYSLGFLETIRLAPPGVMKMSDSLRQTADALVMGGKEKIFTPMFLMVGKKPGTP